MQKIRKGDTVIVTTGRDKGKRGEVVRVLEGSVLVAGINQVKRNVRPNPMKNEVGGIVTKEAAISAANVAIYNASTQKADAVAIKVVDGRKQRVFKSTGQAV
ncbi:MAG TPA: 50S ribosomal protein L24 [Casimicrobium huifangae]|jgi:large subunit ribosomal protein L24|uniref:50S ribosomal protein L24 n=1 Tax=Casimicrobium huifangae TaxID=2591109 RepID=UPI0012EB8141|nr:50S ribosomal protein L24 [Casimicrobium huifangae]HQA33638.1 50S ribosomal protein L24 [Casimicrobium huifangae]HQD65843.1 50S ribosomal protein L24 [Casimicrobium huifangae]